MLNKLKRNISMSVLDLAIVAVFTDLSGKEPHRQVGLARAMTSGSLSGVMVNTLAQFNSHTRRNISNFHHEQKQYSLKSSWTIGLQQQ